MFPSVGLCIRLFTHQLTGLKDALFVSALCGTEQFLSHKLAFGVELAVCPFLHLDDAKLYEQDQTGKQVY